MKKVIAVIAALLLLSAAAQAATLTLTSPVGGEEMNGYSNHTITWTSVGVAAVKLEFSRNNGASWTDIVSSTPAATGSYVWSVPMMNLSQCLIRVGDTANASLNDINNSSFSIHIPTLTLTSPNGGENWIAGSAQLISWQSSDISNVKIQYSPDNGTTWELIAASLPAGTGALAWIVPEVSSETVLMFISDASNVAIYDEGNAAFTMFMPSLELQSPVGAEEWSAGTGHMIEWLADGVENVRIEYTINNGLTWLTVIESVAAATGSYLWTVPDTESANCEVRISAVEKGTVTDETTENFTIVKPEITVITPSGGEKIASGREFSITWDAPNSNNVKIEMSADNGSTWTTVAAIVPAADKLYLWDVPHVESDQFLIQITDTANQARRNESDSVFTVGLQSLTLNAPVGGENLKKGAAVDIEWDSSIIADIMLELSIDNGATWSSIIDSTTASSGIFEWTVPSISSDKSLIRITDFDDVVMTKESESVFRISEPSVTVTAPNGDELWPVGETLEITWNSDHLETVTIEFATDGGVIWNEIDSNIDAASGSYEWVVPNSISQYCRIRLTDENDGAIKDKSDATFTIVEDLITLNTPVGGERWMAGSRQLISWNATPNITSVDISYSVDSGVNWLNVVSAFDASAGSYEWTVPETVSAVSLVKITDVLDAGLTVQSGEAFSIIDHSITLLAPDDLEYIEEDSIFSYSWNVVQNATEYQLLAGADSNFTDVTAIIVTNTSLSASITGEYTSEAPWYWRVRASLDGLNGEWSELRQIITRAITYAPPTNIVVSDVPDDHGHQLQLTWTLSDDDALISHYNIYRSRSLEPDMNAVDISTFNTIEDIIAAETTTLILLGTEPAGNSSFIDTSVALNRETYYYWFEAAAQSGASKLVRAHLEVSVNEPLPTAFSVSAPYPNPFNASVSIDYILPADQHVRVAVFDILGRNVALLHDGIATMGMHKAVWNGNDNASGIYFIRVMTPEVTEVRKALFVR